MLGRHFTVKNRLHDVTTRQYTICNVMHPQVYEAIIKGLNSNPKLLEVDRNSQTSNTQLENKSDYSGLTNN